MDCGGHRQPMRQICFTAWVSLREKLPAYVPAARTCIMPQTRVQTASQHEACRCVRCGHKFDAGSELTQRVHIGSGFPRRLPPARVGLPHSPISSMRFIAALDKSHHQTAINQNWEVRGLGAHGVGTALMLALSSRNGATAAAASPAGCPRR